MSPIVFATDSPPPRSACADSFERLELGAHAPHRFEERRLQLVDVQRRRQLIGKAANHRDILDVVRGALVVLELEQSYVAVAESHRQYDDTQHFARPRLEPLVLAGVGDDHRLPRLQTRAAATGRRASVAPVSSREIRATSSTPAAARPQSRERREILASRRAGAPALRCAGTRRRDSCPTRPPAPSRGSC